MTKMPTGFSRPLLSSFHTYIGIMVDKSTEVVNNTLQKGQDRI